MIPKVFISYSWSSPRHQARVQQWVEQLLANGIDVVFDVYDLKEGNDKFVFMERMVTDPSVSHVLVLSDREYTHKADSRQAGVGTESQIISQEVYDKVNQSKFVPIVCEVDQDGNPYLPAFLKSRIWIDFSTPEAANSNWERLVRLLHGRPAQTKPERSQPPAYLRDDSAAPANPAITKLNVLRQAVLRKDARLTLYRSDFLEACFTYADALRIRAEPAALTFGQKVLEDCARLKPIRNQIVDWVLLESEGQHAADFKEGLLDFLERLLELKSRPVEVTSWNDDWFEAQSVFVYETFLYVVAALMKTGAFDILHDVLTSHYLMPETASSANDRFSTFDIFCGYSKALRLVLAPPGQRLHSPAAELLKRQADRTDLTFNSIMEAELLILLMSLISAEVRWFPQTLYYAGYSKAFPFFVRAARHRNFLKIAEVTGLAHADDLRAAVKEGQARVGAKNWHDFAISIWSAMNMDNLDTLR